MAKSSVLSNQDLAGRYRYLFFDWDGCLADTLPFWLDGYREALGRRGLHPEDRVILRELLNDWAGPERFGVPDAARFVEEMADYLEIHSAATPFNPNAVEVLRALKARGNSTALLTASRRRLVRPMLEARGAAGLFDLVLTVEDVRRHKPDPEVLFKALELLGAPATQALLVGDSDKDLQAGNAAGVATALYLPAHNLRFYDEAQLRRWRPDYVIRDFRELLPPSERGSP